MRTLDLFSLGVAKASRLYMALLEAGIVQI